MLSDHSCLLYFSSSGKGKDPADVPFDMYHLPEDFGTNEKGLKPSDGSVQFCEGLFADHQRSVCREFLPADFVSLLCGIVWYEFHSSITIDNCVRVYKRLVDLLCVGVN